MTMRSPLRSLLPFALLAFVPACQAPGAGGDDWVTLYSHTEPSGITGWAMAGPGEFVIDEGGALKATGGMGLLWYAQRPFEDFTLTLEWAVEDDSDNSGVFVRFPDPGNDPWVAVNEGYEIQICDAAGDKHNTGSVYSFDGSSHIPTHDAGEWNTYEITVVDQQYTIKINGELVNEFTGERSEAGYIGLQNHDDESPVRFRNIRVQEL